MNEKKKKLMPAGRNEKKNDGIWTKWKKKLMQYERNEKKTLMPDGWNETKKIWCHIKEIKKRNIDARWKK